jgi:hypothetical protein
MEETSKYSFWNNVFKQGIIYAVAVSIIATIFDLFALSFTNWGYLFLFLPIFLIVNAIQERKKIQEGIISFNQGLSTGWTTAIIGSFLSSIYSAIYYNVILPAQKGIALEKMKEMFERIGLKENQLDEIIEKQAQNFEPQWIILYGTINGIIVGLIFSLIIAAIFKKDKNPFE